jgi:hypothetical protein
MEIFFKKKTAVVVTTSTNQGWKNKMKPTGSCNTIFNCTYRCEIKKEPQKELYIAIAIANSTKMQLRMPSWH